MTHTPQDIDKELDRILKEFLDAVDYTLEAPIEQADDADFYDRPFDGAKARLKALIERKERAARIGLLDYFDQVPSNELMDWKGLFADTRKFIEQDSFQSQDSASEDKEVRG